MKIIKRAIKERIEASLFKKKAIIIYGARQVGKTTLIKEIQKKYNDISLYVNCDEPDIREIFTDATSTRIKAFIGGKGLIQCQNPLILPITKLSLAFARA